MIGRRVLLIMGATVALMSLGGAPAAAQDVHEDPPVTSPDDNPDPDLPLVAKSRGWTIDEAAAQQRAADEVGVVATMVARQRPDIFVGSALSSTPGGSPTLYVKGTADAFVREAVSASQIEIVLADEQPYSPIGVGGPTTAGSPGAGGRRL